MAERVKGRPPTDAQKARVNLTHARAYRRAFTRLYHEVRALQGHSDEDLLYREAISIRSELDHELDGLYVDGDRGAPLRCLEENCPHPLNHEGGHR